MELKLKRWGWYLVLVSNPSYKIKLLYFKKGGEISKQRHKKRDETWCIIFGKGAFTKSVGEGSRVFGGSAYFPRGSWHHYKAYERTLVLEIQTGICEEEDIERR